MTAYLDAITGVAQASLDNSAAYIKSRLKTLKNDKL
jgi:hypothetical protein